ADARGQTATTSTRKTLHLTPAPRSLSVLPSSVGRGGEANRRLTHRIRRSSRAFGGRSESSPVTAAANRGLGDGFRPFPEFRAPVRGRGSPQSRAASPCSRRATRRRDLPVDPARWDSGPSPVRSV